MNKLQSYVSEQLKAKKSHHDIKKTLLDAGWNETEIISAITKELSLARNRKTQIVFPYS